MRLGIGTLLPESGGPFLINVAAGPGRWILRWILPRALQFQ